MVRSLVYTVEGILTVEYEYNYLGDRISKTVDGEKTTYTLEYSSGLSQIIEEVNNSNTVFYVRGLDLISREELGKTYFYVLDGGNTVRDLVDEDGNVTDKYIFDSFGNEISHEGDSDNSYGFQGEQLDEETGLYYLRARYMNSSTGTFISMDTYGGSLSDPTSLHKYLFANSNPVKYCDPTGYCSILEMDAAEVISLMLDNAMYSMFFYCLDTAATDPACERHSIVGCLIAGIIGGVLGTFIMALSTPFRAVAAVIFGGAGIKKGIDDIADGNVLYGILEVIVGAYFVLTGLGDIIDHVQKYSSGPRGNSSGGSSSGGSGDGSSNGNGGNGSSSGNGGNGSSSGNGDNGSSSGNGGNGSSSGNGGNGSSSGSPSGEGSGGGTGGDLPSGEVPGGDLPSGSGPNNGEPNIPGGNPPVPDSEVGGLPNTEPNLPNSGDNTTIPGATNQSGNVGGNGYGYGEGGKTSDIVEIEISRKKYPESARHIEDAIADGKPDVLTIDRANARANRKASLKDIDKVPGKDLDEYPPAMFMEGGSGASVRPINPSDNRGAGSTFGHQLRQYPNGTKIRMNITDD